MRVSALLGIIGFVLGYGAAIAAQKADEISYPTKPIRLIVSFGAGGGSDFAARVLGQQLTELFGQSVVIDNRTGANGAIGAETAAKSPADGYTLFMLAMAHVTDSAFDTKLPYDLLRDFAPVSQATRQPYLALVPVSLPARSVQELIALAKAKPGQLNYASTGTGGSNHLSAELFNARAGIVMKHIPYRMTAQAQVELIAGRVDFMLLAIPAALPHVRGNKLRALGVTSAQRSSAAPDIETVAQTLPGFTAESFYGVMVPKGTPPAIVDHLAAAIAKGMKAPEVKVRLAADGSEPLGSTPQEFDRTLRNELARFRKAIKDLGIRNE